MDNLPAMKKLVFSILISSSLFFVSCKKTQHSIRFTNNYSLTVNNVHAGSTDLGNVDPGQTSSYQSIPEGDFSITGQASTGYLEGNGSISGKGENKWTITLGNDKKMVLTKDN